MLLRQLSYAIKNQLKTPKNPYISCLSLVLYGIRIGSEGPDISLLFMLVSPDIGTHTDARSLVRTVTDECHCLTFFLDIKAERLVGLEVDVVQHHLLLRAVQDGEVLDNSGSNNEECEHR